MKTEITEKGLVRELRLFWKNKFIEKNGLKKCAECGLYKSKELFINRIDKSINFIGKNYCSKCRPIVDKKMGFNGTGFSINNRSMTCRYCGKSYKNVYHAIEHQKVCESEHQKYPQFKPNIK